MSGENLPKKESNAGPSPTPNQARALPHAVESERQILSALMSLDHTGDLAMRAFSRLRPDAFYLPGHRALAEWIRCQVSSGKPTDIAVLVSQMHTNQALADVMKKNFGEHPAGPIADIYGAATTAAHYDWHVDAVEDAHRRRGAILLCMTGINALYEGEERAAKLLSELTGSLQGLVYDTNAVRTEYEVSESVRKIIEARLQDDGETLGWDTGFRVLSSKGFSLHAGTLVTIAARTSVGKTAFALQVIDNLCRRGLSALAVTREMSSEQLMERLVSQDLQFQVTSLVKGDLGGKARVMNALGRRGSRNLMYFADIDRANAKALETMIRVLHMRGVRAVMIDYLQLLGATKDTERRDRRHQIAEITSTLKSVAKELGVVVLMISQINRIGPRDRPTLENLSESKTIEEDSDQVLLLYRTLGSSEAEIAIAKNRYGEASGQWLQFDFEARLTQFRDRPDETT